MVVVFILVGILVVGGVALAAIGRLGSLPPAPVDRRPDALPADGPVTAADLRRVQFDVSLRGYRQDEVDALLARVAATVADHEARLAALAPEPRGEGAAAVDGPPEPTAVGLADSSTAAPPVPGAVESAGVPAQDHPFGRVDGPEDSRTPPVPGAPAQRGHISG